ncbi:MAG TPA: DUF5985 family protein [Sporichthyaceae bacterium]|jgi:hypothetical protein|nr:DUF5985 family protein [Sporichthyaceae bacterium]
MAAWIYFVCAVTSIVLAVLVVRAWARSPVRLLMWIAMGFLGLSMENVVLFVDEVITVHTDLHLLREATALTALCVLLFGLIWESQ